MEDTTSGTAARARGVLVDKIRRAMVAALFIATLVGGVVLPVDTAQAHLDYCGTGEWQYSDYYRVAYQGQSRDEGGKHYNYYHHYYRTNVNSEWTYWYEEWKECPYA